MFDLGEFPHGLIPHVRPPHGKSVGATWKEECSKKLNSPLPNSLSFYTISNLLKESMQRGEGGRQILPHFWTLQVSHQK